MEITCDTHGQVSSIPCMACSLERAQAIEAAYAWRDLLDTCRADLDTVQMALEQADTENHHLRAPLRDLVAAADAPVNADATPTWTVTLPDGTAKALVAALAGLERLHRVRAADHGPCGCELHPAESWLTSDLQQRMAAEVAPEAVA